MDLVKQDTSVGHPMVFDYVVRTENLSENGRRAVKVEYEEYSLAHEAHYKGVVEGVNITNEMRELLTSK